jgi:hypothetical protein
MRLPRLPLLLAALCALSAESLAQRAPATGLDLLQAMRDAYGGKWYATLTFTQKTTARAADGSDKISTWYESVRYTAAAGSQLRIDIGDPSVGNGVLYTADSLWVVKSGHLSSTRAGGNALLPLIEGVYMQAAARTAAELASTAVDLTRKVVSGRWRDRAVWIAGASSATDTTSPQFWVDAERKIVVRAIFAPVPGRPLMDMHFDGVVPVGGGWLATTCTFSAAGVLLQTEEYSDWKANVPLSAALFDVAQWTTAPHWASPTAAH